MLNSSILKRLTIGSLTTLLCAQGALAHTVVKDQVTASATSTTTSYNAFAITHGCGGDAGVPPLKVIGQSAVFPFGAPAASLTDPGAVWVNLSDSSILNDAEVTAIIGSPDLNLSVGGIQDESVFEKQTEEADAAEVVHALNWFDGKLETNLVGLTQFRVSAPMIADACVSKVRIRIAVANWCERKKNEANDADNNRADWWFTGETGSTKFVDMDLIQPTFWTTLTVNNPNAATGRKAAKCPGKAPHEVAVMPSGADIDTYLPLKPFTKAPAPY